MSLEHVDFFYNDTCLFCGNKSLHTFKAKEKYHSGRDSYNACGCVGRNTWLKAKEALEEYELIPRIRLKTLMLEIEIKHQKNTLEENSKEFSTELERLNCLLSKKN